MKFLGNNITTLADITSVTAGTGLSGGGTSGDVTLNVDAAQTGITSLGTLTALTIGTTGKVNFRDGNSCINSPTPNDLEIAATDITLDAAGTVSVEADHLKISSPTSTFPLVQLKNETDDASGPRLKFNKLRGADGQDGDSCGIIQFASFDDGTPSSQFYGQIETKIADATSGQEAGNMFFQVPSYDGVLTNGLRLEGDTDADGEVDVTIAAGAASTTTIAGTLTMGSTATINNSGVVQVAAQTVIDHNQLTNYRAGEHFLQTNITTVGTIGTGVWNGDAIGNAYLDADTAHLTTAQTFTGSKTMATDVKLNFRDANAYIHSNAANDLAIVATDVEIAATNIILDAATAIKLEQDTQLTGSLAATGISAVFQSSTSAKPLVTIQNNTNDSTSGGLQFIKNRGAAAVNSDTIGQIKFFGENDAEEFTYYATIDVKALEVDDGDEAGKMEFGVAESDGTTSNVTTGLLIEGSDNVTDGEVNVTIAAGAASVTTVAGTLTMGSTAAIDNAGLLTVGAQTGITAAANLVTVGTIGTGVWNATAIASAKMATGTSSAQGALELATTGEADTGTDTARAVTPAGLKSHVDTRYAYAYMTWSASATSSMDGSDPEWRFPNEAKGVYEEDFTKDLNIKATSVGTTTFAISRHSAVNALVIPHTGVCVGFHAHGRNSNSDAAFKAGLFHLDGSTTGTTNNGGIDYGSTAASHECTLRWIATANEAEASGGADGTSGHSFKGPCKLVSNVTDTFAVTAGDALLPAIMGPDGSDEIFVTMSIILKIPLA